MATKDVIKFQEIPWKAWGKYQSSQLATTLAKQSAWEENISFIQPIDEVIGEIVEKLTPCTAKDSQYIALGILHHLMRILQNEIGIGNHPYAIRPLNNPLQTIVGLHDKNIIAIESPKSFIQALKQYELKNLVQLVGIEFFGVNRHLKNFLPWSSIQWWAAINLYTDLDAPPWRLDRTNPNGENIIPGVYDIVGFAVTLNESLLTAIETRTFYNEIRKREYQWNWYKDNRISWREVSTSLQKMKNGEYVEKDIVEKLQIIGLLDRDQNITSIGLSFLFDQNAIERKSISFCGRSLT